MCHGVPKVPGIWCELRTKWWENGTCEKTLLGQTVGVWWPPHQGAGGGREAHLWSTQSVQASGLRLRMCQTKTILQLRGDLAQWDEIFVEEGAVCWAEMDFGSQTQVYLRITWKYFPEIKSLRPHATLTKIRIPWESGSWEIKSRLHEILTIWPWTSYLIFLSVYCKMEIIITSLKATRIQWANVNESPSTALGTLFAINTSYYFIRKACLLWTKEWSIDQQKQGKN